MRLQVYYGGTFDPVHLGHMAIARAARQALGVPVRLLPAADPPHRAAPGATAEHRLQMLQQAIAGEPGLLLDRRELDRAAQRPAVPSYTVDTLSGLRAEQGPAQPLAWLVGADSLLGLGRWHRWQALFALSHFVVADRPGSDLPDVADPVLAQALQGRWTDRPEDLETAPAGRVLRLHQPLRTEAASDVRNAITSGTAWEALVPPAVAAFIREHHLYGA